MIKLIQALDPAKYDIQVLLIKDSIVSEKLEESGIKYSVAKSSFFRKFYFGFIHSEAGYYKWYQIYYLFKSILFWALTRFYFARRELKEYDYDVVHLNSSIMSDWLAAARAKGDVVIHIREPFRKGTFDFLHKLFVSQMRRYASKIIAISRDNAERIGLPEKTEVVYDYSELAINGTDLQSYHSKSVLYVGGAAEIKGFHQIVKSLQYLDKDVKVYFCGSYKVFDTKKVWKRILKPVSPANERIKKSLQTMRQSQNAVEVGLIFDVPEYLNKVCCLVSPFAKPHFSLPVVEAFSCHKPVIVTNIVGSDEIVKQDYNGLIVEKDNPKALADAINYICKHPFIAEEMGINGYKDAAEKYSIKNMSKIAEIYDAL